MYSFQSVKKKITYISLIFFIINIIGLEETKAENVMFRITVVNPSDKKVQTVSVKEYLPKEVWLKDIMDSAGLKVEYDPKVSLYYVHKEDIELMPKEVRTFRIEIRNVWVVPEAKLSDIEKRMNSIIEQLKDTDYLLKAEEIANTIYRRLDEIRTSQSQEGMTRQQRIGAYRHNQIILEAIQNDIEEMEKILVTAGGPPSPAMLADARIKADSPSKNMTWIIVFSIVIFSAFLTGALFFTWNHQARITKESIITAKESSFPSGEFKEEHKNS